MRSRDIAGYLGNDRFAVFLRGAEEKRANAIAQRISRQVGETVLAEGEGRQAALSVCIGGVRTNHGAVEEALRGAAEILAHARRSGPGTIALSLE